MEAKAGMKKIINNIITSFLLISIISLSLAIPVNAEPIINDIMIENIETLIINQEFEKFIDILNNDSILLYLSENKLDIKQLQFIFTHQNELNQEQLNNFYKLSQLSDKGFNNYNSFTNEKIKKLVPAFLFEENYYNIWV